MPADMRPLLRTLAAVGASVAFLATFLPWYSFDVLLPAGGVTHVFAVPITLWALTTLAPVLIAVGAIAALICLAMVQPRVAGILEVLIGLAITAYALVRCFDVPDLGLQTLPRAAASGVRAATRVESGPVLTAAAGVMLLIGSLGDLRGRRPGEKAAAEAPESRFAARRPGTPAGERRVTR
jgi:hypothetical protein